MATKGKAENKKTEAQTSATAGREYASAMDKIRDEMAGDNRRYIQIVGDYLTDYLTEHPEAEAAFLKKDKSIGGSLKAMEAEARKNKEGSVGILDDATAFGIVLKYFGINDGRATGTSSVTALRAAPPSPTGEGIEKPGTADQKPSPLGKVSPKGTDEVPVDPFDLDALMGGDVW